MNFRYYGLARSSLRVCPEPAACGLFFAYISDFLIFIRLIEQRASEVRLSAVTNKGGRNLLHVIVINFRCYDLTRSSLRVCPEPAACGLLFAHIPDFLNFIRLIEQRASEV